MVNLEDVERGGGHGRPRRVNRAVNHGERPRQRWLARLSLLLVAGAALVVLGFGLTAGVRVFSELALGVALVVGSAYLFLSHRSVHRWLARLVLAVMLAVVGWLLVADRLLWPLGIAVTLLLSAVVCGHAALDGVAVVPAMPEYDVPPPRRPFIVMNTRSGGGKVARFGLKEKAESLGAEVVLLEGSNCADVEGLARAAVAQGADLLGAAGGDGTQALVAGVAAEEDVPFAVISAGTRNHFALDLGLDRDDPASCLAALTAEAVEVRVDLGLAGRRTFVNNASFGAYAEVVQSPAYRHDKARTTLALLPDLLNGTGTAKLTAHAAGVTIDHPQALLVSVDPYGTGDAVGLGRRTRLDAGTLGVVAVNAESAGQVIRLLHRATERGLTVLTAPEVLVTADVTEIPVGLDGEAVMMPTPVRCEVRPRALRVRVPRNRPGLTPPRVRWSWLRLRRLASLRTAGRP